jgi:hypothetical protein
LLKTKLLEALGWRVHRIGWRAWARDRDAEVARVAAALLPAAEKRGVDTEEPHSAGIKPAPSRRRRRRPHAARLPAPGASNGLTAWAVLLWRRWAADARAWLIAPAVPPVVLALVRLTVGLWWGW